MLLPPPQLAAERYGQRCELQCERHVASQVCVKQPLVRRMVAVTVHDPPLELPLHWHAQQVSHGPHWARATATSAQSRNQSEAGRALRSTPMGPPRSL